MGVFLLPLLVTRSDDQTHGELFSFVSYGQIQQSVVNPFPSREICATLPSEILLVPSFSWSSQQAPPASSGWVGSVLLTFSKDSFSTWKISNGPGSVPVPILVSTEHIQVWHHAGLVGNPRLWMNESAAFQANI